jgi:hypothetical protein
VEGTGFWEKSMDEPLWREPFTEGDLRPKPQRRRSRRLEEEETYEREEPPVYRRPPVRQTVVVNQDSGDTATAVWMIFHLIMTLVTCGLWLPVWIFHVIIHVIARSIK